MTYYGIIGTLIVFLYIAIIIYKNKEIPSSISLTYYIGGSYWFSAVMFAAAILGLISLLDISGTIISFIIGASLACVGAAPHFQENCCKLMHNISAVILIITSQLWIILYSNPYLLLLWLSAIFWFNKSQRTFYIEMTMMLILLLGLIIS